MGRDELEIRFPPPGVKGALDPASAPWPCRRVREKYVHQLFVVSVALKGLYAVLEIAAGIALQMVSTDAIVGYLRRLGHHGHLADPHDWIGNGAMALARSFSVETQHFYAFYLVGHGVLKLAIVVGLLREKLWAYPAAFTVFTGFIAYQLYRYSFTHDVGLILLSILDALIIALSWHEYRLLRRHLPTH